MLAILSLFGIALAGLSFLPDQSGADAAAEPDPEVPGDGEAVIVPLDQALGAAAESAAGHVVVFSGDADDVVAGGDGDDHLDGQDGDDTLSGEAGADEMHGGRGDDLVDGGFGADSLFGHVGDDTILGGDGDDELNGGGGDDRIEGGAGDDSLLGSLGDDLLIGGAGADVLHGGSGDDIVDGHSGETAPEADYLNGGAGADRLLGGAGDHLHGGPDNDIFALFAGAEGPATVADFDAEEDTLVVLYDPAAGDPVLSTAPIDGGVALLVDGMPVATVLGTDVIDLDSVALVAA